VGSTAVTAEKANNAKLKVLEIVGDLTLKKTSRRRCFLYKGYRREAINFSGF
jgi:hypothetical protein